MVAWRWLRICGYLCPGEGAKTLALEIEEVDKGSCAWQEVCFMQFAFVGASEVSPILKAAPNIPLLGGAGAPGHHPLRAQEPEAEDGQLTLHPPAGNPIDARLKPPRQAGSIIPKALARARAPVTARE